MSRARSKPGILWVTVGSGHTVEFSREDIDNIVEGLPSETSRFIDRQFAGYVTVLDAYVTVGEWETRHHIEPLATAGPAAAAVAGAAERLAVRVARPRSGE